MMKKLNACGFTCLLIVCLASIALAQDGSGTWTWGKWMDEPQPILEFVKNYYGYMLYTVEATNPSNKEPGLGWGREWFADDCQMIVRTFFKYDENCETCEHAAGKPWPDCGCPGVFCGKDDPDSPSGDGVKDVLYVFAGHYPQMKHDNMDLMYRPIGKNVWWVWTRYDYKAIYHSLPDQVPDPDTCINFPGFTILTVDMNQRRSDGNSGRITKIDIGWDMLVYEKQLKEHGELCKICEGFTPEYCPAP